MYVVQSKKFSDKYVICFQESRDDERDGAEVEAVVAASRPAITPGASFVRGQSDDVISSESSSSADDLSESDDDDADDDDVNIEEDDDVLTSLSPSLKIENFLIFTEVFANN